MKEFKNEIEFLIGNNETKLAFERIFPIIENNDRLKQSCVILKSRFNEVNERERSGMLDFEAAGIERSKVNQGLLDLIREITDEEYTSFIERSEIVLKLRENVKNLQSQLNNSNSNLQATKDESIKQKSELLELKDKLKKTLTINTFLLSEIDLLAPKKFTDECKKCGGNGEIELRYRNDDKFKLISTFNTIRNIFVSESKQWGVRTFSIECPFCKQREVNNENK